MEGELSTWLAQYEEQKGSLPERPDQFQAFVRNRGGPFPSYAAARDFLLQCREARKAAKLAEAVEANLVSESELSN